MAGKGNIIGIRKGRFAQVYIPYGEHYAATNIKVGTYKKYQIWRAKATRKGKITQKEFYVFNPSGKRISPAYFPTLEAAKNRIDTLLKKAPTPKRKQMKRTR